MRESNIHVSNATIKQLTDKSNAGKHIKSIHEEVNYPCHQCNFQATQQTNLQNIMRSLHREDSI